jgi:hypothetical protein
MTQFSQYLPDPSFSLQALARRKQRQLLKSFWFITIALIGYELFGAKTDSALSNVGAALITIAALLPSYLWCSGQAQGMPIFPFFALTYTWTFALPLVAEHPVVITYSPESRLFASLTVSGFLCLGTWVWFQLVKSEVPAPRFYRTLSEKKGDTFFLSILAISDLFYISSIGGWLFLDGALFSTIRNAILGLAALASFILAYRLGANELSKQKSVLFLGLLITYMIISSMGLLLIGAASTFLVSLLAFIIGRKKVPFLGIMLMLVCFSLLHYGKGEMRAKYWAIGTPAMQPWDYPAWFSEWGGYGLASFHTQEESGEKKVSFVERSSVIQMLLITQDKSPKSIPFMYGETYAILPQVIVPRIFNASKIRTTEGTHMISVHYKLQTYEQTLTTSISWGLLPEAYANFGLAGCAGLAIVLGWGYGKVCRWSINAPILSAQSLFSILMITFALQTEWTASVYVAALYQSSIVVGGIVICFTKKRWSFAQPTITYEA